ncbi:hypothetical protein PUN28_012545 [Cardiocondyla obscurior]|uniref:Uncharacterized protein n=1 Tax=Cardiocondyla obscurior TaxID=286306 RepID=A0AAW2FC62_9HYME
MCRRAAQSTGYQGVRGNAIHHHLQEYPPSSVAEGEDEDGEVTYIRVQVTYASRRRRSERLICLSRLSSDFKSQRGDFLVVL